MNLPSSGIYPPKKDASTLTLQDSRILMDNIPNPCLLINPQTGRILLSNNPFSEITHFPVSEIIGSDLEMFSRGIELSTWGDGFTGQVYLKRRNRSDLETKAKLSYIDKNNKTALISFTTEAAYPGENDSLNIFLKHQKNLFKNWEEISKSFFIRELRNVIQDLFEPEQYILYLSSENKNELERPDTQIDEFPEKLLPIEIERMGNIDVWEPGKRVLTEIHRAGRSAQYQTILSFSFDWYDLGKGLGVLAFLKPVDLRSIRLLLSEVSGWISSLTEHFQKLESVKNKNLESESRKILFEGLFENTNDALVILNQKREIIHFNENFCSLFSYSPIELLNRKWENVFGENVIFGKEIAQGPHGNKEIEEFPSIVDRNGKQIPVKIRMIKINDFASNYLLVFQSAAEKISAEKQKQSLEKKAALGEVVADFAHEVRNPVNNISTGLQLVLQDLSDDDENQQVINRMQEDCIRINYLMESILSFSRQENRQFQELDLYQLLSRISYQLRDKFEKRGHSLKFICDLQEAPILGDQRSIEQVIINFVNNSSEAIADNSGIIGLKLDESPSKKSYFVITISDTGPGIPGKVEERLFQPFVSEKPKGTGLGLAIARRIVESHGGFINVQTFPGGTIFEIFLPKIIRGD